MVERESIKFIGVPPRKDVIEEIIDEFCYRHQQTKIKI